jgi:hypothetical protein
MKVSCSWCGAMNEIEAERRNFCACGHRADLPRAHCDCERCAHGRALFAKGLVGQALRQGRDGQN